MKAKVDALQQQAAAAKDSAKPKDSQNSADSGDDADPSKKPATQSDVDGVRADLANFEYQQQRDHDTTYAISTRGTTIGGTLQTRASFDGPGTKSGAPAVAVAHNSSYDIPLVQLTFAGSLFKDYKEGKNLNYKLGFSYARTSPATTNSYLNLTDAYLLYNFDSTNAGPEEPISTLTFGQQLIPFGLEAQADESLRPVINSAQFVSKLGIGTRQTGLILRGDNGIDVDYTSNYRAALVSYALGLVNGNGPNQSDSNNHKDLLGRVAFTIPVAYNSALRQLTFGSSFYRGKSELATNGATPTAFGLGTNDRYGFDIYYNHAPFGVTYELLHGIDQAVNKANTKTTQVYSRSDTLTLFYTWGEQWVSSYKTEAKYDDWWPKSYQPFFRWDRFDANTLVPKSTTTISTLGFNLFFAQTTKLQLNLNLYQTLATTDTHELLVQFQYGF